MNITREELFPITPHQRGEGFTVRLANGVIDIPDERGMYVVSTGCGSGKTESIKSLIRHKYEEGILYCVDTKDELTKMYEWVLANLVNRPDTNLSQNDVLMISSDYNYNEQLEVYRNNPQALFSKKVILVTHVRFFSNLINYFVIYNPTPGFDPGDFDGDFGSLMNRPDLRKYIIFDETPTFIKPFVTIPKQTMGCFSMMDNGYWCCRSIPDMDMYYQQYIQDTTADPFPIQRCEMDRNRKDVALRLIHDKYRYWQDSGEDKMEIVFKPADLNQQGLQSHILIYEGAGDILFDNSDNLRVIDIPEKYNSKVNYVRIPFGMKRRKNVPQSDERIELMNRLKGFLLWNQENYTGNTLIVVWQSLGEDTDKTDFVDRLEKDLHRDIDINPDLYHITYFGATDTKSTNLYRDYRNIILVGKWSIPNTTTSKFRECYASNTSNEEQTLWYYIQLISRIGIRYHNGGEFNIYYTEDYPDWLIEKLWKYFNENHYQRKAKRKSLTFENRFIESRIIDNHRNEIVRLSEYYPKLKELILTRKEGDITIPLGELKNIFPNKKPKTQGYDSLKRSLHKLGVNLIIT